MALKESRRSHLTHPMEPTGDSRLVALNPSPDRAQDLAALSALTLSLSAAAPQRSLESALDILREATGAEAAELFLAEPGGRGMVLTCHRGLFQQAFFQITRFNPGQGFPGLVLACQEPILTRALSEDPRYLRTRVKEKGFRSCVSVPLRSPREVMGSLQVAFRHPDADLDRALHLLSWAGIPVAMMLDSSLLHAREEVNAQGLDPSDDLEADFRGMSARILRQMIRGPRLATPHLRKKRWSTTTISLTPLSIKGFRPSPRKRLDAR